VVVSTAEMAKPYGRITNDTPKSLFDIHDHPVNDMKSELTFRSKVQEVCCCCKGFQYPSRFKGTDDDILKKVRRVRDELGTDSRNLRIIMKLEVVQHPS